MALPSLFRSAASGAVSYLGRQLPFLKQGYGIKSAIDDPTRGVGSAFIQEMPSGGAPAGGGGGGQPPSVSATGGGGGGSGGGFNPAAAQSAQLRNEILSRRARANAIFDALTNTVNAIAQERTGELESDFGRQVGSIQQQAEDTSGDLLNAFGSRGLLDSSYRINAQERAAREASGAVDELGRARGAGLADIGRFVSGTRGGLEATREGINAIDLNQFGDDPNALAKVRDQLDQRIRELQTTQAETQTGRGYRQSLRQAVPNLRDLAGPVKQALDSLVRAAVPANVKQALASGIINSSPDPEERLLWQRYFDQVQQQAPEAPVATGV